MNTRKIGSILVRQGILSGQDLQFIPMQGGVSSDIYLVKDKVKKLVVKKALSELRVKDPWQADTNRNKSEQDYIQYVGKIIRRHVPEIIYSDADHGFFVMEFLDNSFINWKSALMQGDLAPDTAREVALLLAKVHTYSWEDPKASQTFGNQANFYSLRVEPYLLTTAERNPPLQAIFRKEAERLIDHHQALVHGDFSPKNIMVGTDRLVLLDHEVAWFGDPAFDVAFMLTHLHLKKIINYPGQGQPDLPLIFWDTYFENLTPDDRMLKSRTCRLWLMILLARVDGKSPVEYFEGRDPIKQLIRSFCHDSLLDGDLEWTTLRKRWNDKLENHFINEN